MTKVGRPRILDSFGNPIDKIAVNVTIPVKLKQFLDEKCSNRSELFVKVVQQLYDDEICPKCYTIDVTRGMMGAHCNGGCSRHEPYYFKYNKCSMCNQPYEKHFNLPKAIKGSDEYGCTNCLEQLKLQEK
jgi:predicted SprT family Zn-dependent metalloprotease